MQGQLKRTFDFTELGFQRFLDVLRRFSKIKREDWQKEVYSLGFDEMPDFFPFIANIVVDADFRTMIIVIFNKNVDIPGYGICNFICLDQFRDTEDITAVLVCENEKSYLLNYLRELHLEMQNQS